MDFAKMCEEVKTLQFREKRFDSPDFFEFVIRKEQVQKLDPILRRYFGPPFKPAGEPLQGEPAEFLERVGGIRRDQTLYFLESADKIFYTMIWPWGDRVNVTVKMAQCPRSKK